MLLYQELQRYGLFSADGYTRALIRAGLVSQAEPIMIRITRSFAPPPPPPQSQQPPSLVASSSPTKLANGGAQPASQLPPPPQLAPPPPPVQDLAGVISFIPPTVERSSPLPVLERLETASGSGGKHRSQSAASSTTTDTSGGGDARRSAWLLDDAAVAHQLDEHILLEAPGGGSGGNSATISVHERILIQLPIAQEPANRDACNQRATLLYGIGADRKSARNEPLQLAAEISRIWQKRVYVQFFVNTKECCFKRRNQQQVCLRWR